MINTGTSRLSNHRVSIYESKTNIQDELVTKNYIITQNECSGKSICPLTAETLINTGISGLSNHRITHCKCIFRKTIPPLKAETIINTGTSRFSNQKVSTYKNKINIQDELVTKNYIITQNEFSGKRVCPLTAETPINTGISEPSNHRITHCKCIFRKTVPPLKAETTINTGTSRFSNHRVSMYKSKINIQDELVTKNHRITQNEHSRKRVCPLTAKTLINTDISGLSNHRITHCKCIFRKTIPPFES